MRVKSHQRFAEFKKRIGGARSICIPWHGVAYRVTTLDYPTPRDILRGEGSFRHGGRWNAIGSFRAVYGSVSDTVAVAESRANATYANIPYPFRAPRLLVAVELSVSRLIDFTNAETREEVGVGLSEFCEEDWRLQQARGCESFTQMIGRACFENDVEALLVPSARIEGEINVAYFPENRRDGSSAKVLEAEKLERLTEH